MAKWEKGRDRFLSNIDEQTNPQNYNYGFNKVKFIYACAYSLEILLNDTNGIDPDKANTLIANMEHRISELREWHTIKTEEWNRRNATT